MLKSDKKKQSLPSKAEATGKLSLQLDFFLDPKDQSMKLDQAEFMDSNPAGDPLLSPHHNAKDTHKYLQVAIAELEKKFSLIDSPELEVQETSKPNPKPAEILRNLDLDKLRAFAVICVVLAHAPKLLDFFPYLDPWSGVDLFFVISGFIVSTTFTAHMPDSLKNIQLRTSANYAIYTVAFFCRRFFRLTPAIVTALTIFLGGAYLLEGRAFFDNFNAAKEVFAILTYQYNLFVAATGEQRLVWHWSLSLEEQFYLIFPFLMYWLPKQESRVKVLSAIIVFLTLVVRPYGLFLTGPGPYITTQQFSTNSVLPYFRADAILYGCILFSLSTSLWYQKLKPTILINRPLLSSVITMILLAGLAYAPGLCYSFNSTIVTISIISSLLVWLASYNCNLIFPVQSRLINSILIWIGTRSYGLYLLNVPCTYLMKLSFIRLADIGFSLPNNLRYVLTIMVYALVTEIIYRFIEKPILKIGNRFAKQIQSIKI